MCALLRLVGSPEGRCFAYFRCLLPNVSTTYISYVISFPRVEIQLREITSIPLKHKDNLDKSSAALNDQTPKHLTYFPPETGLKVGW